MRDMAELNYAKFGTGSRKLVIIPGLSMEKVLLPWDKDWYIHLAQACLTGGPHSRIKEIECPTFVLGARNDMVLTGKASEDIADALGCRLHMFEKYRHAFYDEAPDYYSRVYDFLTTL